jgi:hypothetical protein
MWVKRVVLLGTSQEAPWELDGNALGTHSPLQKPKRKQLGLLESISSLLIGLIGHTKNMVLKLSITMFDLG